MKPTTRIRQNVIETTFDYTSAFWQIVHLKNTWRNETMEQKRLVYGMDFEEFNSIADSYLEGTLANEVFEKLPEAARNELDSERRAEGISMVDGAPLDSYLRRISRLYGFGFISKKEWMDLGLKHIAETSGRSGGN